jgi:glycosyltransferase involved in cell wall biosynthesis
MGARSILLRAPSGFCEHLHGAEVEVLFRNCREQAVGVVVFQKVNGRHAERLARRLASNGVRTIFYACDSVDNRMADACQHVLAVSSFLKNMFRRSLRPKIRVLDDALELPESMRNRVIRIARSGRLRGVYLSSAYPDPDVLARLQVCAEEIDVTVISKSPTPPAATLRGSTRRLPLPRVQSIFRDARRYGTAVLRLGPEKLYYKSLGWIDRRNYAKVPDRKVAFHEWSLSDFHQALSTFDVGLLPAPLDSHFRRSKSINRLATLMAAGLAVVASPVPSYCEAVVHRQHAIIARTRSDWERSVRELDQDRDFAQQLAESGRHRAWERFAPDVVLALFREASGV